MFVTRLLRRYIAAHVHVVTSTDGCEYLISFDQMGMMPVVVTHMDRGVSHLAPLVRTEAPAVVTVVTSQTSASGAPRPSGTAAYSTF